MKHKDEQNPFKCGTIKQPSEKRIKKVSQRTLKSFHVIPVYFILLTYWRSFCTVFRFLFIVIKKFFLVQYLQKLHITRRPVKHVDHELDQKVPFRPEKIKIYMQFINIWIHPLEMLLKRFGIASGAKLCREFFRYLILTYNEAYRMYDISLTTTVRPKCPEVKTVRRIQCADPHYMCVPSLHIAIVCLCFCFYKKIFVRENFTQDESKKWLNELYTLSVEIGETVLYVKQHSVNCIPAALYMMTKIAPEVVTTEDCVNFINDLFKNADDIKECDRKKINAHIQLAYERFLLEGITEDDWTVPVARWLREYVPYKVL